MSYETLFSNQVEELLESGSVVIIDIRDERSYAAGHIADAVPATEQTIETLLRRRHEDISVLVYCYHGNSSRDLCQFLVRLGLPRVYNLEGGWQAWSAYQHSLQVAVSERLAHWLGMNGFDCHNLNSRIMNGMTTLMYATLQEEHDFVVELLNAGVDINGVNDDGNNALWFACVNEDLVLIELLIHRGIDINNQNTHGATALIYAASSGKYEVVKLLTEKRANLFKKTHDDFTALDSAANLPVLRYLKQCYSQASAEHYK